MTLENQTVKWTTGDIRPNGKSRNQPACCVIYILTCSIQHKTTENSCGVFMMLSESTFWPLIAHDGNELVQVSPTLTERSVEVKQPRGAPYELKKYC